MKLFKATDYQDLSRKAADLLAAQVLLKPDCVLGLATGSTPIGAYQELVRKYEAGALDFSQVTTFNLDEYRGLTPSDPQSYAYFMHRNLFDHVNLRPGSTHLPDGLNPDPAAESARYEAAIRAAGGVDLQLLGMGHNGHIGFNEPCGEFPLDTHSVDLAESTIRANTRFFDSSDQVPRQAYTMGIGTILRARRILIVVSGADKAEILKQAFYGPVTPQVPASVLQLHPDVTLVADTDALSAL